MTIEFKNYLNLISVLRSQAVFLLMTKTALMIVIFMPFLICRHSLFSVLDLAAAFDHHMQYYRILLEIQQMAYFREVPFHIQNNINQIFVIFYYIATGRYSKKKQFVLSHVYYILLCIVYFILSCVLCFTFYIYFIPLQLG